MIQNIIVAGAGTAGLMAAMALKRHFPRIAVRVVRSAEIGVIGVGESTTPQFPSFLFDYLGLNRKRFYAMANPTWKTGIHFLWGPRKQFEFAFDFQLEPRWNDLTLPNGYYCDQEDTFDSVNMNAALMLQGKAFAVQPGGAGPVIGGFEAFHLFNPLLVKTLETFAIERGIEFIDAKICGVTMGLVNGEEGVQSIQLEDGRQLEADLFVDASGFRSELLGRALQTPFVSYDNSLFCDRACVGSWDRTDEFIYPYTIAETMEAGWCWQIDHEHAVNRGYVYSSRFVTDDQARDEFLRKNPKAKTWDHVVKFRSGRYAQCWVKNVFGIGNACGFVEPLEATALMVASSQIKKLVTMLQHSQLQPHQTMRVLYNEMFVELWDNIRDFLALHYRFNSRLTNAFWTTCQNEADVSGSKPLLDFYADNGPTNLCQHYLSSPIGAKTQFGLEGFLVMLVGQRVPYQTSLPISDAERDIFRRHCLDNRTRARAGLTVAEALKFIRHPDWQWHGDKRA